MIQFETGLRKESELVDLSHSKFEYTAKISYCDLYSIITINDI